MCYLVAETAPLAISDFLICHPYPNHTPAPQMCTSSLNDFIGERFAQDLLPGSQL